eukprot:jgi/Mesen1/5479/ME000276S04617
MHICINGFQSVCGACPTCHTIDYALFAQVSATHNKNIFIVRNVLRDYQGAGPEKAGCTPEQAACPSEQQASCPLEQQASCPSEQQAACPSEQAACPAEQQAACLSEQQAAWHGPLVIKRSLKEKASTSWTMEALLHVM